MVKKTTKEAISFKPAEVIKKLLAGLPERARQIIKKRYGLAAKEQMTLQAIGEIYGITRERVRQIEEFTLRAVRRSATFEELEEVFTELEEAMNAYGGVVHEEEFFNTISDDPIVQNQIHFLLVLGDPFIKIKEDDVFHHRWTTSEELAEGVEESLQNLCQKLSDEDLLEEDELVELFLSGLVGKITPAEARQKAQGWLRLCKQISQSPIGKWGLSTSPQVRIRGVRDFAFLVLRQHGSPLHFSEIARLIAETFSRSVNVATTHNELIKDDRFVLVGRGIYALTEWGYSPGIVRDVIKRVLEQNGPMGQEAIVDAVLKERHVKPATIMVNLKNPRYFEQVEKGKYHTA